MHVIFRRTGERRYSVTVVSQEHGRRSLDPAPGYDENIPQDLVHYAVEAELGFTRGVYGRAAEGGGTFIVRTDGAETARQRARQQRAQQKRESSMQTRDEADRSEMADSERLAAVCDLAWRRRHGQKPDPARWSAPRRCLTLMPNVCSAY